MIRNDFGKEVGAGGTQMTKLDSFLGKTKDRATRTRSSKLLSWKEKLTWRERKRERYI